MASSSLIAEDRDTLAARLRDARRRTDEIFEVLDPKALYERPIAERHRLVFYLGHVEAFDWNLVARQAYGVEAFQPAFDKLFAFGIDPVGGGLPNEPASDWPARDAIDAYNTRVRATVDECVLGRHPIGAEWDETTILNMAIEHRLMHAETLAYLLHRLPADRKLARPEPALPVTARATPALVRIPEGTATLGRHRRDGFGWDNEFDAHTVAVPAFSIDSHKVTNGRFLEFVRDGGYRNRSLWNDGDWEWIQGHGIAHPGFWRERDGEWSFRGMFGDVELPLEAPVYVSHAEATAYARRAGRALPTEPQFHRAAYGAPDGSERQYPWGDLSPDARHGNFDLRHWSPTPVGSFPAGNSAFGVSDLVGNGWEWTSTEFRGFEGFRPHPLYAGYSKDFFDGHHFVMKGGSPRTAACMLRRSFRNWFQPHYPHAYSTFRLITP